MKHTVSLTVTVLLTILLTGCQSPSDEHGFAPGQLRTPRGAAADGIEAIGGLTDWRTLGAVTYDAVVIAYDDAGRAHVNRHDQAMDLAAWTLTAHADRPEGQWTAVVDPAGTCTFEQAPGALGNDVRSRLAWALPMCRHRVAGVLNLVATAERSGDETPARVNGVDCTRVAVTGDTSNVVAYYFDVKSGLLRFVTSGADAPSRDGTITVYDYRRLDGARRFPEKITVFKIGDNTLISKTKVLEVDLKNITLHPRTR